MKLKGARLLNAWEDAMSEGISMAKFARSLGRTRKSVDSEIARTRAKIKEYNSARILIYDIETAPILAYVWGLWDQNIYKDQIKEDWFVISWAAKWFGEDGNFGAVITPEEAIACDDKRVVTELWKAFDEADIVVAHNAVRFDNKKSNWRFLYNGLRPPMPYKTVDTLLQSRKIFGASSNSLDYLTDRLGLRHKQETGFELWDRCKQGDPVALKAMYEYNLQDIVILEDLYKVLRGWMKSHPNVTLFQDEAVQRCPVCGGEIEILNKRSVTAANAYRTYRCIGECGSSGKTKYAVTTKEQRKKLLKGV